MIGKLRQIIPVFLVLGAAMSPNDLSAAEMEGVLASVVSPDRVIAGSRSPISVRTSSGLVIYHAGDAEGQERQVNVCLRFHERSDYRRSDSLSSVNVTALRLPGHAFCPSGTGQDEIVPVTRLNLTVRYASGAVQSNACPNAGTCEISQRQDGEGARIECLSGGYEYDYVVGSFFPPQWTRTARLAGGWRNPC